MDFSRSINIVFIIIIITQFTLNIYIFSKINKEHKFKIENEEKFFCNKHIKSIGKEVLNSNEKKLIFLLSSSCQACKEIIDSLKLFNNNILKDIIIINTISEAEENNNINIQGIKTYLIGENVIINELEIRIFPYAILIQNNKILKSSNISKYGLIDYISNIGETNND